MARKATIKDVAAQAEVSVATVSLVLNGRPARVADATRERIFQAARELHYVPNQNARSLVTNESKLIALIVPDIENLFFIALAKSLEDLCSADGYSLIISSSDDSRIAEHNLMNKLSSRGVDGIFLIATRQSTAHQEGLREDVQRLDCPVILIDRLADSDWCDGVGFNNRHGGYLAAAHLLQAGHRRIGCISGDIGEGNANARRQGFLDALAEWGVNADRRLLVEGDYRFPSGYAAADQIVDNGATAVFCANDLMAAGFMRRLSERKLGIPDDISLVGYDNVVGRFGVMPDITAVDQNVNDMAAECYRIVADRIGETNSTRQKITAVSKPWLVKPVSEILLPTLVVRDTVRALRINGDGAAGL